MPRFLIIAAAGSGTRLGGGQPKALVPLCGRPMIAWTLQAFSPVAFSGVVIAAPPGRVEEFAALAGSGVRVVAGGDRRTDSVRCGFEALAAGDSDLVCVHDAARPFVTADEANAVLDAAERVGAAVGATPVVDTIKRGAAGRVVSTIERDGLYAAATPQAFRAGILRRALASAREATDEAALCEALGVSVAIVPLSRLSFKITTPEDLEIAQALLSRRLHEERS